MGSKQYRKHITVKNNAPTRVDSVVTVDFGGNKKLDINLDDLNVAQGLVDIVDKYDSCEKEFEEELKKIEEITDDMQQQMEIIKFQIKICKELATHVEGIFGEGMFERLYGIKIPSMQILQEFFKAIQPAIEDYKKEVELSMQAKYNKNRVGNIV